MKLTPDYAASIAFLTLVHPNGRWTLTSIHPNERGTLTETFTGADDRALLPWLKKQGSTSNIYYTLNPLLRPMDIKPSREDVASMAWVHVDVDPRAGEDLDEERERALGILQSPPDGVPLPTGIIFSGGGYQALWRLQEPLEINGKVAAYEDAKRYNQKLETIFGADNCHNVDRILRLPGTINRPNAKKVAKGRTPALATLVEWREDLSYPITDFTKAQIVQTAATGFTATRVEVSGNVARIGELSDLPDGVPGKCKIMIAQGFDPDNADSHESRSESLFYVCCELVRSGVDDDTIFSLITDPDWKISASVLDKGSSSHRYALRQIERARDNAVDPWLQFMNDKHAVIRNFGGKPQVIEEVYDRGLNRWRLTRSSFTAIRDGYCNKQVHIGEDSKGNPKSMPLGNWWLNHEHRRSFESIVFAPGREVLDEEFNMWRGYGVESCPGNKHLGFLGHIKDNICVGDESLYEYVISWLANAIQDPGTPGQTSLVMRGDQGVGKGFFANAIGHLFGRHYLAVSNAQHLTGNFNSHLRDCVILFADEAFYAGDKRHASSLKSLITEPMLMIEGKGMDSEAAANCLHVIMASNEQWVVPAGMNERRFCLLDVADAKIQNTKYFGDIMADLKDGGYENLLHALMMRDLSEFDVRKVPKTAALQDQKVHSLSPMEEWWYSRLTTGSVFEHEQVWPDQIVCSELVQDYVDYAKKFNLSRRGNETLVGRFMSAACPPSMKRYQSNESCTIVLDNGVEKTIERPYVYQIPSLKHCRDWWDDNFGGPYDWPEVMKVQEQPDIPF